MKIHTIPRNSSDPQASLFTRLGLAGPPCVSVLAPARGATLLLVLFAAALWAAQSEAASIPVYNTNDSLAGSLRQAIQDANPQGGDTIVFRIPTSDSRYNATTGIFTITLASTELVISKNLTIDGRGQITVRRSPVGAPLFRIFHVTAGNVVLSGLTISGGDSDRDFNGFSGGGIRHSGGDLTVLNCTISDNNGSGAGGGIANSAGTLTVNGCTFRGNTARSGGGITNTATANISRSTFSGNSASPFGGGGIENFGPTLTLTSCTIAGNTGSAGGGGVYSSIFAPHVRNTIIALNSTTGGASRDVFGSFISDGYNFIGVVDNHATGFGNAGSRDQAGTTAGPANPGLGPLLDHGGPTQTSAPLSGSFVIDQGDRGGLTSDQRGFARVIDDPAIFNAGDGTDIGAVERGLLQTGPIFTVTNLAQHSAGTDGCTSDDCTLLKAIYAANANSDANIINFAPGLGGSILNTLVTGGLGITQALNSSTANGAGLLRSEDAPPAGLRARFYRFTYP